jgi:peptide/nickel transport system substrate-binding protein
LNVLLKQRFIGPAAVLTTLAIALAACGSSSTSGSGSNKYAANQNATGSPTSGGTLKILGATQDVDHLDPASAYTQIAYTLMRGYTRQLISYPASDDFNTATSLVPDVATAVPNTADGSLSADAKTYKFTIRDGVMWNSSPSRPVTSQDFVHGLKRLCNPVNPVGAPQYYESTISGFKAYCDPFLNSSSTSTPAQLKAYMDANNISGVTTPDSKTLIIKLDQPAPDFLNILAMPFASAAPAEYDSYVPDSPDFQAHMLSDGPYAITKYTASTEIDLGQNSAWKQSSDPIRHQYVGNIVVTEGSNEAAVQQAIESGTADMEWDTTVPIASQATKQNDPRFASFPVPGVNPFLAINTISPNNGGALGKVAVRQALEYAIDKNAIAKVYGGLAFNTPLDQVIPPGTGGYQQMDPYSTPNNAGDGAKCKSLLAAAGYPNGFTLKDVYRNSGKHPDVFQIVKQDLANCGVTVDGTPVTGFYADWIEKVSVTKAGGWDIAEPGWGPDWFGPNSARSIIVPLFDGRLYQDGSPDNGDYNSPTTNALIDKALSATTSDQANNYWHQADVQIMKDAAIVPFLSQSTNLFHSTRVHNAIFVPFSNSYDITQAWLNPTS